MVQHPSPSPAPGALDQLFWELGGVREPHVLPVWMGRCGWCCHGVCVSWWAGVRVHCAMLPCGCSCPGCIPEGIALSGSMGAWAMIRLWKRGFSPVRAWCFAEFASAKPVASPATEAQTSEYSTLVPASSEMGLPGMAVPWAVLPHRQNFQAGARGAAPFILSTRRKDPRTPQRQPQGRNKAAARHSRRTGGCARPQAPRLCSQ